ncbi:MAG: UvrD-helicase domain-containing protein, partial [Clostridiales bacterium]|nr:UvrD-helicase domain-containing protein [Clostridiales bacterium]
MINLDEIKKEYEVNDEQAMALDIDKNIALHAGAGSGKTRVLTRRFLKLLIDKNTNVDDIVAITFTKKAALEMKERVLDLVNEFIEKEQDDKKKQRLKKIKEDVLLANISTFHSFCDTLIKENYYLIGIEPMYQIIEDVDTLTLLNRFSEEILNKYISDEKYKKHFEALFNIIGVEFVTKGTILKEVKGLYKEIKTRGDRIEEAKKYTEDNILKYFNGDKSLEPYQQIVDLMMDMVEELDRMYKEEKRKSSLLDFNDLENYTLDILENHSEIKKRLRERYKYFLVDEFQDTNDIQLKILMHLTEENENIEEGRLFVVGDIKQSIYLFRGANYKVFEEVTKKIGNKLNLSTNYRSYDKIVEIINDMFKEIMQSYEPSNVSSKIDGEAGFVYEFIKEETKEKKNEFKPSELKKRKVELDELATLLEETKEEKRSKEAEYVADKIIELNKKGIEYKDIAILFRNRNNILDFENALKNKGIPYTILGGIGFYERQEIKDLINLVRFIYRQDDKLSFLGVIRSPFVGLSDNEVIDIFSFINKEDKIEAAIGKNKKLDKLFKIKSNALFLNVYNLLKYADKELNIKEILLSSEDGIQKYRNFEKFLEIAIEFDSKGIYSSLEFVEYVENLIGLSEKESQAFLDTENSDAVKIMTVHASKGLEFEAVFVPCLDYSIEKNSRSTFVYDKFDGDGGRLGIAFKDDAIKEIYEKINQKRIEEEKKEEIRILYVAATRAIRFLSFSGVEKTKDRAKSILSEMDKLPLDSFKERTKEFEEYKKDRVSEVETKYEFDFDSAIENIELDVEYIPNSLISISRYMAYKQCPRKYFFKFIAKIDEEALSTEMFEKIDEEET